MGTGAASFLLPHVNHVTLWLSAALFSAPLVFYCFTFCLLCDPCTALSRGGGPYRLCYGYMSTVRGILNGK